MKLLSGLNVSHLKTASVKYMTGMFQNCSGLTELNLSTVDTAAATNMSYMFSGCTALANLNVRHLKTNLVTNMSYMFNNCTSLVTLDLRDFVTKQVTNMSDMFYGDGKLTAIYVNEDRWSTAGITTSANGNYMFTNCSVLKGEFGTKYSASYVTYTRAKIDGGTSSPGYLSIAGYRIYFDANIPSTSDVQLNSGISAPTRIVYDGEDVRGPQVADRAYTTTWDINSATGALRNTYRFMGWYTQPEGGRLVTKAEMSGTEYTATTTYYAHWKRPWGTSAAWEIVSEQSGSATLKTLVLEPFADGATSGVGASVTVSGQTTAATTNVPWFGYKNDIQAVRVKDGCTISMPANANAGYLFANYANLIRCNLDGFDTGNVTNMDAMFYNCAKMTTLTIDELNTTKVQIMSAMFYGCKVLSKLDLASFGTGEVVSMSNMFGSCQALTALDVSMFDMRKVQSTEGMFWNCIRLPKLDLTAWETPANKSMKETFRDCTGLTELKFGEGMFDTSQVTTMEGAFQNCKLLTALDLNTFLVSNVTNMNNMFNGCAAMVTIGVSGKWSVKNAEGAFTATGTNMFAGCTTKLTGGAGTKWTSDAIGIERAHIDGGTANPGYFTLVNGVNIDFQANLPAGVSGLNGGATVPAMLTVVSGDPIAAGAHAYANPWAYGTYDLVSGYRFAGWYDAATGGNLVTQADFPGSFTKHTTYYAHWKRPWGDNAAWDVVTETVSGQQLKTLVLEPWEGSAGEGVTIAQAADAPWHAAFAGQIQAVRVKENTTVSMPDKATLTHAFEGYTKLQSFDFTGFNLANVTDVSYLFKGCSALSAMRMDQIDTGRVTSMRSMFEGCASLVYLDVTHFATTSVTDMNGMFKGCAKLVSLELSPWNTANVTDMGGMFSGCKAMSSLVGANLVTSNVTDMSYMFEGCAAMPYINLTNFETPKATTMEGMFKGCTGAAVLDLSSFETDAVTNMADMMSGCTGLATLDLANFDTAAVTDMHGMFAGCTKLATISVSASWNTAGVTGAEDAGAAGGAGMFTGSTKLVGGAGTVYDAAHLDVAYAHVDGGTANPGYLTLKGGVNVVFDWNLPEGVTELNGGVKPPALVAVVNGGEGTGAALGAHAYNDTWRLGSYELIDQYRFMGWFDSTDETDTVVNPFPNSVEAGANNTKTYYAQWKHSYSVKFEANLGEGATQLAEGVELPHNFYVNYGETVSDSLKDQFESTTTNYFAEFMEDAGWYAGNKDTLRVGYTFDGWRLKTPAAGDGSGSEGDGDGSEGEGDGSSDGSGDSEADQGQQLITAFPSEVLTADLTYEAVWTAKPVSVGFNVNLPQIAEAERPATPDTWTGTTDELFTGDHASFPAMQGETYGMPGYTFQGWYPAAVDGDGNPTLDEDGNVMLADNPVTTTGENGSTRVDQPARGRQLVHDLLRQVGARRREDRLRREPGLVRRGCGRRPGRRGRQPARRRQRRGRGRRRSNGAFRPRRHARVGRQDQREAGKRHQLHAAARHGHTQRDGARHRAHRLHLHRVVRRRNRRGRQPDLRRGDRA